jgi:hypothetical protein
MTKYKVILMNLNEILLDLKLIEKHTYYLKINKYDFEEKLKAITEFKFNPFSKMIFKGEVNKDNFELVLFNDRRKNVNGAIAKGTYFELNGSLIINIEIKGVYSGDIIYLILALVLFWNEKIEFRIMFILFFMLPFMYFMKRGNIKRMKNSLNEEFAKFESKS